MKPIDKLQTIDYAKRKHIRRRINGGILHEMQGQERNEGCQGRQMKNGKPATKGVCPKCGTNMYRIGKV